MNTGALAKVGLPCTLRLSIKLPHVSAHSCGPPNNVAHFPKVCQLPFGTAPHGSIRMQRHSYSVQLQAQQLPTTGFWFARIAAPKQLLHWHPPARQLLFFLPSLGRQRKPLLASKLALVLRSRTANLKPNFYIDAQFASTRRQYHQRKKQNLAKLSVAPMSCGDKSPTPPPPAQAA